MLAVHTSCAIGYYKDPARTAATFREIDGRLLRRSPATRPPLDADGTLTLLGRGSNCINSGGEKVWPEEVEEVLKEHPGGRSTRSCSACPTTSGARSSPRSSRPPATTRPTPTRSATGSARASRATSGRAAIVFADEVSRTTVGKLDYEWARARALDARTLYSPREVLAHERGGARRVLLHEEVGARAR